MTRRLSPVLLVAGTILACSVATGLGIAAVGYRAGVQVWRWADADAREDWGAAEAVGR